jgi:hypothetical protein
MWGKAACCLLPAACCLLPAACCRLPAACCLLPAACCLLPAACCLLPAACCLLPAACCLLPAACTALQAVARQSCRGRSRPLPCWCGPCQRALAGTAALGLAVDLWRRRQQRGASAAASRLRCQTALWYVLPAACAACHMPPANAGNSQQPLLRSGQMCIGGACIVSFNPGTAPGFFPIPAWLQVATPRTRTAAKKDIPHFNDNVAKISCVGAATQVGRGRRVFPSAAIGSAPVPRGQTARTCMWPPRSVPAAV